MLHAPRDAFFDGAPIPMWESDLTALSQAFTALRADGVTELAPYLAEDPARTAALTAMITIVRVNAAATEHLGITASGFAGGIAAVFGASARVLMHRCMAAVFDGATARCERLEALTRAGHTLLVDVSLRFERGPAGVRALACVTPAAAFDAATDSARGRADTAQPDPIAERRREAMDQISQAIAKAPEPGTVPALIASCLRQLLDVQDVVLRKTAAATTASRVNCRVITPRVGEPWALELRPHPDHARLAPCDEDLLDSISERLEDLLATNALWELLSAQYERLDLALEGAGAMLWDWRPTDDYFTMDARYARLLGLPPETRRCSNAVLRARTHPDDLAAIEAATQAHLADPTRRYDAEYRVSDARGRWRWMMSRGRVVERDADGRPLRIVGTNKDITRRKEAERRLQASEERARVTLECIADGVITTDRAGNVTFLNRMAERLTGVPRAAAIGRPLASVFAPRDERAGETYADVVATCLVDPDHYRSAPHDVVLESRSGDEFAIRLAAAPLNGEDGAAHGVVVTFTDATTERDLVRRMLHQATHDALTGLVNRPEFERRLHAALRSTSQGVAQHALLYLDMDQFKIVNDTVGHTAGDQLLKEVAELLLACVRGRDSLARLGGDEFGMLLEHCSLERAEEVAERIVGVVRDHRFLWEDRVFDLSVSIGVVALTSGMHDVADALSRADVACYEAKDQGRNRFHVYRIGDSDASLRHGQLRMATAISDALEASRFVLHAQPIVALSDERPMMYEVLVRMLDPQGRIVSPGEFIPAAERFRLMGAVDRWVIRRALSRYDAVFGAREGVRIAINLSGESLSDEGLLDYVTAEFERSGVSPRRVCFEITETGVIRELRRAKAFIDAMRALGCHVALDDFGTGLSSLTYLRELPVDYLKIDGRFVRELLDRPSDAAMVEALHQMAAVMGIKTIAEFVESAAVADRLRELGIDFAQGYSFGRPQPLDALASADIDAA